MGAPTPDVSALMTRVAEQERELGELTSRIAARRAQIELGAKHRDELRDALGDDEGRPLPLGPLVASLLGAVAANAAMFFSMVVWLTRFRETVWNLLLAVSVVLALVSIPRAKHPGAGGMARLGLRRFAILGVVLALAVVALAVVAPRPCP